MVPLQRLVEIARMDPERDLMPRLPALFAEDLSAAMGLEHAPPRAVLFFDTHEAFWGQEHLDSDELFFQRDEWLRRLLLPLVQHPAGVIAVVAGRNVPRWPEASRWTIDGATIELYALDGLSDEDARAFLRQPDLAIMDGALQQSVLEYARVGPNEVHPLHLGLCADIVLLTRNKGREITALEFNVVPALADKNRDLLRRLLRWVDADLRTAVSALSVCRSFNIDIYRGLATALGYRDSRATFGALTRLSFVRSEDEQRAGWFRFHDLLRRLIREQDAELTRAANEGMERYYRERGGEDPVAMAEAIYHVNRLDWERGVAEWASAMQAGLRDSRYDRCRALIGIRPHLVLQSDNSRGIVYLDQGHYFAALAEYGAARASYDEAIIAFDAALACAPDDVEVLNNKGIALASRGDSEEGLAAHDKSKASYTAAIAAYDTALVLVRDYFKTLNNKGTVLKSRGDLEARLAAYNAAKVSYTAAIAAFDAALVRAPDPVAILNNKGDTLRSRGDLEARLAAYEVAKVSYTAAITAFDAALARAPNDVVVLGSKGIALTSRGDLEARQRAHEAARASYTAAIATYDAALARASDPIGLLSNKGIALRSRGDLETDLGAYDAAGASYDEAIIALDAVLARAPDDVKVLNNKGNVLTSRGKLEAQLGAHDAAKASYSAAIAALDTALALAPDDVEVLNNKGRALASRGELEAGLRMHEAARASYTAAITTWDAALACSPDNVKVLNNKGIVLAYRGRIEAGQGNQDGACSDWNAAVAVWTRSLALAPDRQDIQDARDAVQEVINNTCSASALNIRQTVTYAGRLAPRQRRQPISGPKLV
jgi:tetratricopeptide (TPR) repeat protein